MLFQIHIQQQDLSLLKTCPILSTLVIQGKEAIHNFTTTQWVFAKLIKHILLYYCPQYQTMKSYFLTNLQNLPLKAKALLKDSQ